MTRARKKKSIIIPRKLRAKIKPLRKTLDNEVRHAMKLARGQRELAAALLGIGKTTLYRRLKELSSKHVARKNRARASRC